MKNFSILIITFFIVFFTIIDPSFQITLSFAENNLKKQTDNQELLDRIDFGNAYIIGQTIKSGAVYLLQRKKSEIKSMLQCREDYREEILEDFFITDLKIAGTDSPKTRK